MVGLTTVDNRGGWKVSIVSSRGSTLAAAPFNVKGATASVNLSVSKGLASSNVNSGDNVTFIVGVTNSGPNDAANVTVTDVTPLNATFVSATQTSGPTGPTFLCVGTSTVVCSRATLAAGALLTLQHPIGVHTESTGQAAAPGRESRAAQVAAMYSSNGSWKSP